MENKEIHKELSKIREENARVETKVDILIENNKKIDIIRDVAKEADKNSRYAHKRIDKIDKWMFALGSAVAIMIITAIINTVIK